MNYDSLQLSGRNILVLGLGDTGLSCAKWLSARGATVTVADSREQPPHRQALARLAKSQESIAQIAADLGYADPSAFYRAFVEWTGMAPAHYRKRLLREA